MKLTYICQEHNKILLIELSHAIINPAANKYNFVISWLCLLHIIGLSNAAQIMQTPYRKINFSSTTCSCKKAITSNMISFLTVFP